MGKGVLYKINDTTASKTIAKKMNDTTAYDTIVKHADDTTWYDNYPMEQEYTQQFDVVWTQPYNGSGTKLDEATWGNHPRSGDSIDFHGLFGFDRTAMRNFVAGGVVQKMRIIVYVDEMGHAGEPIVNFHPHKYTSVPASYSSTYANTSITTQYQFEQTGYDYQRWVDLTASHWWNGDFAGILVKAPSATAANSLRLAGTISSHNMNAYNTRLEITVLK